MNTIPHGPLETAPTLSPGYVRRQLRTMDEMVLSIRDASKANQIDLTKTDRDVLADDVESHAKRVIQLALEIRDGRAAK